MDQTILVSGQRYLIVCSSKLCVYVCVEEGVKVVEVVVGRLYKVRQHHGSKLYGTSNNWVTS